MLETSFSFKAKLWKYDGPAGMKTSFSHTDKFLEEAVNELINKYKCHTVILYGSRARGDFTDVSDYDLMGVARGKNKLRLAEKRKGKYLDVFIFPEKDLEKVGEQHLYMKGAKVLYQKNKFGTKFLIKLNKALKKTYRPLSSDELKTIRTWVYKMLERIEKGDVEALYRRSWLHQSLLSDYFHLRKKRYWGSKESFQWLKENDIKTYNLFESVLNQPSNLKLLRKLIDRVVEN